MPLQRQARRLCLYPRYRQNLNRSVQLVARNHEARTEVESFVQQVARYIRNE